jgi:hypothetical protein
MCCLQCNENSPEGSRFCTGCGTPLAVLCGGCGAPNQLGARFCGQCSTPLGAKPLPSLELRAVLGLCEMLGEDGQRAEAGGLLEDTCGWFTEGLNTPDLCEARALLEKLRSM